MLDFNTHMFTGHERDRETGLDYMLARYYSGSMKRFVSVDPTGANPANAQSWNKYAYCLNNPLKYLDGGGRHAQFFLGTAQSKDGANGKKSNEPPGLLLPADRLKKSGVEVGVTAGNCLLCPGSVGRRAASGAAEANASSDPTRELVGFSRGAIAANKAAGEQSGRVDLLIMVDPLLGRNQKVSENVDIAVNISRGTGLLADGEATAKDPKTTVINLEVPDGISHTEVDNNAAVQGFIEDATKAAEKRELTADKVKDLGACPGNGQGL